MPSASSRCLSGPTLCSSPIGNPLCAKRHHPCLVSTYITTPPTTTQSPSACIKAQSSSPPPLLHAAGCQHPPSVVGCGQLQPTLSCISLQWVNVGDPVPCCLPVSPELVCCWLLPFCFLHTKQIEKTEGNQHQTACRRVVFSSISPTMHPPHPPVPHSFVPWVPRPWVDTQGAPGACLWSLAGLERARNFDLGPHRVAQNPLQPRPGSRAEALPEVACRRTNKKRRERVCGGLRRDGVQVDSDYNTSLPKGRNGVLGKEAMGTNHRAHTNCWQGVLHVACAVHALGRRVCVLVWW